MPPTKTTTKRPDWDAYFINMAHAASKRAACTRSQVGAVLVDADNRVIGTGYNGAPSGETHCTDGGCPRGLFGYEDIPAGGNYANCVAIHAEVNAVAHSTGVVEGSTVYVTRAPCADCAKTLRAFGVERAVWGNPLGISEVRLQG